MCESWVGDWTNCNILTPSSSVFSSTSFSFCWAAQSGFLRAHSPLLGAGSHYSILLIPTDWTCLWHRLIKLFDSTCFLWASHLHPIQTVHSQSYTLISSTGCTFSLINGWVEGQYVTYSLVLFDPYIGPYQVLLLRATVDLGAMITKRYYWSLTIRLFNVICRTLFRGVFLPPEKNLSVYSTDPADCARGFCWLFITNLMSDKTYSAGIIFEVGHRMFPEIHLFPLTLFKTSFSFTYYTFMKL